ncbi:MAG: hypothetical protein FWG37_01020 [Clostridia bacterium]|nr:hypothetical protein [Clostridia bacterium]
MTTLECGNMVWLGTVLLDTAFPSDPMLSGSPCEDSCLQCVDQWLAAALNNPEMDQAACYAHALQVPGEQELAIRCRACRSGCPHCFGSKKAQEERGLLYENI